MRNHSFLGKEARVPWNTLGTLPVVMEDRTYVCCDRSDLHPLSHVSIIPSVTFPNARNNRYACSTKQLASLVLVMASLPEHKDLIKLQSMCHCHSCYCRSSNADSDFLLINEGMKLSGKRAKHQRQVAMRVKYLASGFALPRYSRCTSHLGAMDILVLHRLTSCSSGSMPAVKDLTRYVCSRVGGLMLTANQCQLRTRMDLQSVMVFLGDSRNPRGSE